MTRFARTLTTTALAAGVVAAGLLAPAASSAAVPTSLTASPDASVYNYGARTTVRGHLSAKTFYGKNLPVQIGQVGANTVHGSTRVDSQGNFKFAPQVFTNTTIAIFYPGDATYAKAQAVLKVSVRVLPRPVVTGYFKTGGGYYYVHAGQKGNFAAQILPSKAGRKLAFRLQVYRSGWKTLQTAAYTLDKQSAAGVTVSGSTGFSYRVRAEYGSDSANVGNVSGFAYLRFA